MLPFEQIKAIESALGQDKAGPVIQALETVEERVKASVSQDLATKRDLKEAEVSLKRDIEELRLTTKSNQDARLAETKAEIIKWVAGMLVAQAALIAALVKLL